MSNNSVMPRHTFSVAPMLDWTDRHCRFFHRLLTSQALLYTEMVTTGALLHGASSRFLAFTEAENPVAYQLGGSDPIDLALCAEMIEDHGYAEINLNVGCPSDRVQNGRFGACLMAEPDLVAECTLAMQKRVSIPVTVKSRIGVDDQDSYEDLHRFVSIIAGSGCKTFIIHARKAWLSGLSPKQNRVIPPLRYEFVFQIKKDFPDLTIILNGGINSLQSCEPVLQQVDGVMVGREAYHNPYLLAEVDSQLFHLSSLVKSREQVVQELIPYVDRHLSAGGRVHDVSRHILGLFHGMPGARKWRRILSEKAPKKGANSRIILHALNSIGL